MNARRILSSFVCALLVGIAPLAQAGRECTPRSPAADETRKALALATDVFQYLDRSGAKVALLGRVGSDQSARGVRYTHVAFATRDHPKGRWAVTHVLNICGQGDSDIYDEGLANFFLDEVHAFESKLVIPSPAVQAALTDLLAGPMKRKMHQRDYSLIAYPWDTRFQNSDGWALELSAAALAPRGEISSRAQAQAWLRRAGYVPSRIRIGVGERIGTRLFAANVRYGDHPDEAWQNQTYEVVSGDSVLDFLLHADAAARAVLFRLGAQPAELPGRAVQASAAAQQPPMVRPPAVQAVEPPLGGAPKPGASASVQPGGSADASSARAQILSGTRSLIVGYACRPRGYLRQCRQLEPARCEELIGASILECFAPISDAELADAQQKSALATVERVGWCAADRVDRSLGTAPKPDRTSDGRSCADMRSFQQ